MCIVGEYGGYIGVRAHGHPGLALCVTQHILQQIGKNALRSIRIRQNGGQVLRHIDMHLQLSVGKIIVEGRQLRTENPAQVNLPQIDVVFICIQAGEVVKTADERLQGAGAGADHLHGVHAFLLRSPAVLRELQVAEDRGQRRAQVV